MKPVGLLVALLALLVLVPAHCLQAASIDFTSTVIASGADIHPEHLLITIGGTNFYAFHNLDSGSGTATAITGFASLAGLAPASLTFAFGDLELVSFVGTPTTATETYAEGDLSPHYFNMFSSGSLIATGTEFVLNVVTDRAPGSPTFGQATGFGEVTLTGVGANAFFEEVMSLTGGSGVLQISIGSFIPTTFSDPETFSSTGTFTAAPVPEPGTLLLLGSGLFAATGYRWRRERAKRANGRQAPFGTRNNRHSGGGQR